MSQPNETPEQRQTRLNRILKNECGDGPYEWYDAISAMIAVEDAARADMFTRDQVIEAMDEALRRYFMHKPSAIEIFKMKDEIINQIKPPTP